MKRTPWLLFYVVMTISCLDEPDCYQLDNNQMMLAFNVLGFGADRDTLLDIRTAGVDSVFYENTIITSAFVLPLNPNTTELKYVFRWKNGRTDSLVLGYSAQIQFVSPECGQRYVYGNLVPITSSFDSVRVLSAAPTFPTTVNLVIYRCAKPYRAGVKFKTLKAGVPADSILSVTGVSADYPTEVNPILTGPSFYLPLNPAANSTTYEFTTSEGGKENLKFSYTRIVRDSPLEKCGTVTFFSRIKIAATSFDTTSTKLIKPNSNTIGTNTTDPAIINFEISL